MNRFPVSLTHGAVLLRTLTSLPPGKAINVTRAMLMDIEVPANPLDRQTPEFLVGWFKSRLPFYCTVTPNLPSFMADTWTFYRPR